MCRLHISSGITVPFEVTVGVLSEATDVNQLSKGLVKTISVSPLIPMAHKL